jgi:peptidoglycan/LPS O-acetylase OafA/YrhL
MVVDKNTRRVPFLDGVRGVAAVLVLLYHCAEVSQAVNYTGSIWNAPWQVVLAWPLRLSEEMVPLFIFVSAFSLSWAEDSRRAYGRKTTLRQFYDRRAKRIAPIYYLALAFGLLTVVALPVAAAQQSSALGDTWDLSGMGILSHLLFFQNLDVDWALQANGPLWTIASEVQLYAVFPFLYWALRRRGGVVVPVGIAAVAGALCLAAITLGYDVIGNQLPVYFVAGALLAVVWDRVPVPSWLLTWGGCAALLLTFVDLPRFHSGTVHNMIWLVAIVLLMWRGLRTPGVGNPLASRWPTLLGAWSYPLYAIHLPIVAVVFIVLDAVGVSGYPMLIGLLVLAAPISILAGQQLFNHLDARAIEWSRGSARHPARTLGEAEAP